MCALDLFHDPQFRVLEGCHYRGVNVIRYRHAIVLETSQQEQNIFFVRTLLDFARISFGKFIGSSCSICAPSARARLRPGFDHDTLLQAPWPWPPIRLRSTSVPEASSCPQREEEGNRAGRIRLLSPLRVFLPIKDQLTVRLEGCDQHYAMLKRNLLYTG